MAEKKKFIVWTLEDGRWKEWGAGETNIQNRSELVKDIQKSAKKANGCVRVRRKS
tara:strand:+ start:615 stop:779 length:165 start_codon:yes stop_codon:yes gene_type:complete